MREAGDRQRTDDRGQEVTCHAKIDTSQIGQSMDRVRVIALSVSAIVAFVRFAPANDVASDADLARWGTELANGEFQVRQNATRQLAEAGSAALPTLAKAVQVGDSEVRRRAVRAVMEQCLGPRHSERQPARELLDELASSDDAEVARVAQNAVTSLREATANLAAAELTRRGAVVMPETNSYIGIYKVQIPQSWSGGDDGLAMLAELGQVTWLSIENAPLTDEALPHIAKLTSLQTLYLGQSRMSGKGLAQLAPLSSLRYLSLRRLPVEDRHLAELPKFPQLMSLGLDSTLISDAGLALVARQEALQQLWLDGTRITDVGLKELRPLANLRALYLPGTRVAGPGLADLQPLANLRYLSLRGVKFEAKSLTHVASLTQLESLGLDNSDVGDDHLASLAGLSQLRVLWLSNTAVTDEGLKHLKGLTRLQIVYLTGTKVTAPAVEELKKSLPQTQFSL